MKLGLHISDFTWGLSADQLAPALARIARDADEAGFDRVSVMDHVWQIAVHGPPEHEMLEAYTTLGFLAAHTSRVKLLTLVTGVVYREPGLLAKIVTTLDVLSQGRAMLGIGAAWNEDESRGLGLFFPPMKERFERLEEALVICRQMFDGPEGAHAGKHYTLGRTLNNPRPVSPRVPILIGGSGEKKTLRFVAKYADSCNLFAGPDIAHKLEVLKQHCAEVGRDYDEIEKTVVYRYGTVTDGARVDQVLEELAGLRALGFSVAHGGVKNLADPATLATFRDRIIPEAAKL
ncbi:F420-dependent oxidoreductase-like protein [Catenuloplanes nepalensis]|uniref:F420-dependent oxidoreductase-like protein n=1 Tax=Catenuloplanes nepalensis TaxID=587533 RepID=A0ABT9MZ29_9ACTN|nr:LLM class F420-dependent oxidoreductase [Catenuloplanes nepalensis]MDP9796706.1 F420-dependent oxidoreductase-like protein [Catenuloplanes nepalensis]